MLPQFDKIISIAPKKKCYFIVSYFQSTTTDANKVIHNYIEFSYIDYIVNKCVSIKII